MAHSAVGDLFVQTGQRVSGFAVQKFFKIPFDQFKIFALVLWMAGDTAIDLCTVPAAPGLDPFRQAPVAGQAFQRVDLFLFRMALRTIGHSR